MSAELETFIARGQSRLRRAFMIELDGFDRLGPSESERLGALADWAAIPIGAVMRQIAAHVRQIEGLTPEDRATAAWDILNVVLETAQDFARVYDPSIEEGIPERRQTPRGNPLG